MKRRLLLSTAAWSMSGIAQAQPAPMLAAAESGDLTRVQRLLDAGTPVDSRDGRQRTALLLAERATIDRHGFATLDVANLNPIDDTRLMQILRRLALCIGTQGYPPRTERL